MSSTSRLGRWFGLDNDEPVRECRYCGTNVPPPESTCPTCGSDGIVSYEL